MVTRAPRKGVLGRRTRRGNPLPALVLVLGLAAVAAFVTLSPDLSDPRMRQSPANYGLFAIGTQIGPWQSGFFSPFADHRLRLLTVLLTIVYLGSATALGSLVVRQLQGEDRWPRPVFLLAGFLPGYLMVLAPLQLLFAAMPLLTAAWIAIVSLPAAAIVLHRRTIVRSAVALRDDRGVRRRWALAALGVIGLTALATVHRLQAASFFMVQDSILWFLYAAADQLHGALGSHLGQWNQQSDEWVFNAPLMFSSRAARDFQFPIYATQSLSLASFGCVVLGLVHRLAERRKALAGAVAVVAVLASTPVILPWVYTTIISGDNPVLWTGHPGRHIGIVAPWVAMLLVGPQSRRVAIALGLATLGLGFTSLQVLLSVLAAVGATLAWRARSGHRSAQAVPNGVVHVFAGAALAMIICAFWWLHHVATPARAAWCLVAAAAVAVGGAVAVGAAPTGRRTRRTGRAAPIWIGAWLTAVVTGLLLSNNFTDELLHGRVRRILGTVLPGYDGRLLARTDLGNGMFSGLSFPKVSGYSCALFSACQTFAAFAACYGLLLVVALATWLALGPVGSDAAVNARRVAWLSMVAALAIALVIVFFTGVTTGAQAIVFTRFLEVPYYGLLALAAMTFAGSRNRATMVLGTGVLVVWSIVPAIAAQWPAQMVNNATWLLDHVGSR